VSPGCGRAGRPGTRDQDQSGTGQPRAARTPHPHASTVTPPRRAHRAIPALTQEKRWAPASQPPENRGSRHGRSRFTWVSVARVRPGRAPGHPQPGSERQRPTPRGPHTAPARVDCHTAPPGAPPSQRTGSAPAWRSRAPARTST